MKVAEQLMNPLGMDDDDFQLNAILDRNFGMGMAIVDQWCQKRTELPTEKDPYWSVKWPNLPYTNATVCRKVATFMGSTSGWVMKQSDRTWAQVPSNLQGGNLSGPGEVGNASETVPLVKIDGQPVPPAKQ